MKGVPAEQVKVTEETAWALRGDRGLTYAATPPEGTKLVAGAWWAPDYRGAPLVSFDAGIARGWGVAIGDTITVNVLGRNIDLTIANLRSVDWRGLGMNFTLVASPGLLEAAPHTHIATVRGDPAQDGAVLRALTDAFPNISGIRVRDALEAVAAILARVGTALSATGSLTLLAGAPGPGRGRRRRAAAAGAGCGGAEDPRRHAGADPRRLAGGIRADRPGRRAAGGAGRQRRGLGGDHPGHAGGLGAAAGDPGGDGARLRRCSPWPAARSAPPWRCGRGPARCYGTNSDSSRFAHAL